MDDLVKAMGGPCISKSRVSRLCEGIDARANAFLARSIRGGWSSQVIGATSLKKREAGRIVSPALTVDVSVDTNHAARRSVSPQAALRHSAGK